MSDLDRAWAALTAKQLPYTNLWRYYDGDHPIVYSTERLRRVFDGIQARFSQNWCAVVVDATHERISLQRFVVVGDERATDRLNELWRLTEMTLDDDDAHLAALVIGEAYLMAWLSEDGEVEAYFNDPRLCHIEYDPDNPRKRLWAAKWWVGVDEKRYLTMYYPDRLEYYVSRQKATSFSTAKGLQPLKEPEANPFKEIPVFHLRRERRAVRSELLNVVEPQDAINKLLADMMVSAEFGAFRQRYAVTDADLSELKNQPGSLWQMPSGDGEGEGTQVGEFSATDLVNYLDAIDRQATAIGAISRTPKHYFFGQGGDPSGEALIAMESPLVQKCTRYIERFGAAMRQFGAFLLRLDGWAIDESAIQAIYADPRTVQPLTQSLIRQNNVNAGIPLRTLLRDEGKDEAWLDQMDEDRATERSGAQMALGQALLDAQRGFDQGGESD